MRHLVSRAVREMLAEARRQSLEMNPETASELVWGHGLFHPALTYQPDNPEITVARQALMKNNPGNCPPFVYAYGEDETE